MLHCQNMQKQSVLSLALATVYRPPGPNTDFLKLFADFLSDLLVSVEKALIVGDFNIHVDNTNDALGLAFTDLINSLVSSKLSLDLVSSKLIMHRFNHTLDFIISDRIDLTDIDIVPKIDDVTDHFLVSCMLHINDLTIWLRVIVLAELLFQPLKIDLPITCLIYLNCSMYP